MDSLVRCPGVGSIQVGNTWRGQRVIKSTGGYEVSDGNNEVR